MVVSKSDLRVAGFFAGAGGLDLGFKQAGFNVPYANEYDKTIWETYEKNFPKTFLDRRSILNISPSDVPEVTGFIGGPPCQSWSEAGSARGINDKRGKLFLTYMDLVAAKLPAFFQAENVSGILFDKHSKAFRRILNGFAKLGYNVSYGLLRASNYGVPQDRDRVFIIGYRTDLDSIFTPPNPINKISTLKDAIWDLRAGAKPSIGSKTNGHKLKFPNHEYMTGSFSSIYMSRNRVRSWDEPSFTIQAGARHAPIHPQAPKMIFFEKDKFQFNDQFEHLYRRISVREAARIQTFPDDFIFHYSRITDGYKMIGNAVPVQLAKLIAQRIYKDLIDKEIKSRKKLSTGVVMTFEEISSGKIQLPIEMSA
jgi:DNA (cytosine-5)-methyltransferase 1